MNLKRQSQILITIPQPCNIPWNGMTPVDTDQRHCFSCDKVITDFSKMSDDELMLYFRHANGNMCGRFSVNQINRPFQLLPDKSQKAKWWRTLLLIPLTLFGKSAKAQNVSVPYAQHSHPTHALSLQTNDSKNENIKSNKSNKKSALVSIPVSHHSHKYKYVWNPNLVGADLNSFHISATEMTIAGGMVVTSIDWSGPWSVKPPPKVLEKSIFASINYTINEFWKRKRSFIGANQNESHIEKPEAFKEVTADQPKQKPKPQPPALPASNEITGILPEERKKFWRF
jgi:hypothetical protein